MGGLARFLAAVMTLAACGFALALASAGFWLPKNDSLVRADAIVVLGGSYTRPVYAAELYTQGYARVVFLGRIYRSRSQQVADSLNAGLPREEEISSRILRAKGVPDSAIRLFGHDCLSTWDEGQQLAQALGPELKSLLVVTSARHTRRAGMILRKIMPDKDIRMLATPYDPYPRLWWRDKDTAQFTVLEMAKLAYYLLGGRFLGASGSLAPASSSPAASPSSI